MMMFFRRVRDSSKSASRMRCQCNTSGADFRVFVSQHASSSFSSLRHVSSPSSNANDNNKETVRAPPACTTSGTMKVYNSLSQSIQNLLLSNDDDSTSNKRKKKGLACYTCGPTVYGPAHLGHARTYVCLDIFRRVLEHATATSCSSSDSASIAPPPLFVLNITDVDDKILNAASEKQEPPLELARRYEAEFWRDWDALHCLRPHVVTRVTEHVASDIVPYIETIAQNGVTYELQDDGLYFDVRAFEDKLGHVTKYGKLAPPSQATAQFYNNRMEQQQDRDQEHSLKKDPRDFCLWKRHKPGEAMYWPSPWGDGRPGWHIECSAMIDAVQRLFCQTHTFAIHAGGVDLKFPHHTNEIAQAEAHRHHHHHHHPAKTIESLDGDDLDDDENKKEWIPHWIHTGHLHIDGLKMSKSLKNFITVQELLCREDDNNNDDNDTTTSHHHHGGRSPLSSPADDFRLWCLGLSGPYRGAATYSPDRLDEARTVRIKVVRFLMDGQEWFSNKCIKNTTTNTKKWRDVDRDLFDCTHDVSTKCMQALLVSDLDGATFVTELVRLATAGTAYMASHTNRHDYEEGPCEPIAIALETVRRLLSLVGFSDVTVRAGFKQQTHDDAVAAGGEGFASIQSQIIGGERALLDELVSFRTAVRNLTLADATTNQETSDRTRMQAILDLCDDRRDRVFPSLGVELFDGKINGDDDNERGGSAWKFCLPRHAETNKTDATTSESSNAVESSSNPSTSDSADLRSIPLQDFFRLGQYKGQFSEFAPDGMPMTHSDGSKVSNRLRQKLQKKREKHAKRLEKA